MKCAICGKELKNKNRYTADIYNKIEPNFWCEDCAKKFQKEFEKIRSVISSEFSQKTKEKLAKILMKHEDQK